MQTSNGPCEEACKLMLIFKSESIKIQSLTNYYEQSLFFREQLVIGQFKGSQLLKNSTFVSSLLIFPVLTVLKNTSF